MMAMLPPIKELQSAALQDLNLTDGILPTGVYRRITGTYTSVSDNTTEILCLDFNATVCGTGASLNDAYTAQATIYPSIINQDSSAIVMLKGNSGSQGGTGGGGGGTFGGGSTAGGTGGSGGSGGSGGTGTGGDAGGSGGGGGAGTTGGSAILSLAGSNGSSGSNGGTGGAGGILNSIASGGGAGKGGGGGGGAGFNNPEYAIFYAGGSGGSGGCGIINGSNGSSGGSSPAGGAGGAGGVQGASSAINGTSGGPGVDINGTAIYGGGGGGIGAIVPGTSGTNGGSGTGASGSGASGSGGGGGGAGSPGLSGVALPSGASGANGGAGGLGGTGGKPSKSLFIYSYNSIGGYILSPTIPGTSGSAGSTGSLGSSVTLGLNTVTSGNGGTGGAGGNGSSGANSYISIISRNTDNINLNICTPIEGSIGAGCNGNGGAAALTSISNASPGNTGLGGLGGASLAKIPARIKNIVLNTVNIDSIVNAIPPSGLSYNNISVNQNVSATSSPTLNEGSPLITYTISPSLPTGLSINSSTGVISGTPTNPQSLTSYTVTATNSIGNTTATINITVNAVIIPSGLSYNGGSASVVLISTTQSYSPTLSAGTSPTYTISPSLPSGLSINSSTGVISGTTPSSPNDTTYTVTATNSAGNTTASFRIRIVLYIGTFTIGTRTLDYYDPESAEYSSAFGYYTDSQSAGSLNPTTFKGYTIEFIALNETRDSGFNLTYTNLNISFLGFPSNSNDFFTKISIGNNPIFIRGGDGYQFQVNSNQGRTFFQWYSFLGRPLDSWFRNVRNTTVSLIIE